jgi:hypothetical protein
MDGYKTCHTLQIHVDYTSYVLGPMKYVIRPHADSTSCQDIDYDDLTWIKLAQNYVNCGLCVEGDEISSSYPHKCSAYIEIQNVTTSV